MNQSPVPDKPSRNLLADQPGFWLALFSICGLVLLLISGPAIEARINRRIPPQRSNVAGQPAARSTESEYSVVGLKWVLATTSVAGVVWTVAGQMRKSSV
jgi:hypothetical protein